MKRFKQLAKFYVILYLTSFKVAWSLGLLFFFGSAMFLLPPPGLNQVEAIGPFIDDSFPSLAPEGDIVFEETFTSFQWESPIVAIPFPNTSDLLIVEMDGRFFRLPDLDQTNSRNLVMDIQDRSWYYDWSSGGTKHGGIQNVVFHPDFGLGQGKDYIYVYYVFNPSNESTNNGAPYYDRLSRFTWNGSQFDPNTELILINQYDTSKGHDGSGLAFGNDGFLYVAVGDEGTQNGQATPHVQKIDDRFRGGVWRIDVDMQGGNISHPIIRQPNNANVPANQTDSYTQGYYIPNDNPWVNPDGSVLEEFYAIGLRQPFRMTYDGLTGNFWIGDVGGGQKEEVNLMNQAGLNFQWNYLEGTSNGFRDVPSPLIGADRGPFHEYGRSEGNCIIGGYVYRGASIPSLVGKYVFGDNPTGKVWALDPASGNDVDLLGSIPTGGVFGGISSFGFRHNNELLILKLGAGVNGNGKIYKIKTNSDPSSVMPATLSATGIFTNLETLSTRSGIIPYDVNTPLWSAGTVKKRWVAIPNDGTIDTPNEKIDYSEEGVWGFPVGTVFIKHFEKPDGQKLETRVWMHGTDGNWFGSSYKWRPDGLDADLLLEGAIENLTIEGESFEYLYPSISQCATCHNSNAGSILGFRTNQLNRQITYPSTGRSANQLETFSALGFIPNVDTNAVLSSVPINNNLEDYEIRARSYLNSNCAHCHQPGNNRAVFDTRLSTDLSAQNLINGEAFDDLGTTGMEIIKPQFTEQSAVYLRMNTMDGCCAMPILAKGRIDQEAVQLIENWINSIEADCQEDGSLILGNPTVDAGFIDAHSPAVFINKTDTYQNNSGETEEICINNFSFYAKRLGAPVTPFFAKEASTNSFEIISIGQTRNPTEYLVGSNVFNYADRVADVIKLLPGEEIFIGFAYTEADGSGANGQSVIPATNAPGQDQVWQTYYTSNNIFPGIQLGKNPKLASGVATNLSRSYSFNIDISINPWPETTISPTTNLAFQKPATQSSTAYGGFASRAVDGNNDGVYSNGSISHTAVSTNPWWRVDLGEIYQLDKIELFNRTDCCIDRLVGAKLLVGDIDSNDPLDYNEVAVLGNDYEQIFDNLSSAGRFIMVFLPGTDKVLSISELRAFGSLPSSEGVTVYTNCNFGGSAVSLTEGEYPSPQSGGFINDAISSIKVNPGYEIIVYQHGNFGGNSQIFTSDIVCLSELGFNDQISSIKVQKIAPNLAYRKPATQSSTSHSGIAALAVDGNNNGIYTNGSITHTPSSTNPWWRVDLGESYQLTKIEVFNRTDCCIDRLVGASLLVGNVDSNNPADYTEIATLGNDYEQIFNNISVEGRYIMVFHPGDNKILSIAELRAYGSLPTAALKVKVKLEGPYKPATDLMTSLLSSGSLINNTDPYGLGINANPDVLSQGGEKAITDWLKLELRAANDPTQVVAELAALLQKDGQVVSINGSENIQFPGISGGSYYIVVKHYNHLGVMTNVPINIASNSLIDFSSSSTAVFSNGGEALKNTNGTMLLIAGDANRDGIINAVDKNASWNSENGQSYEYGTTSADFNLDGAVNAVDRNAFWRINNSKAEQIP